MNQNNDAYEKFDIFYEGLVYDWNPQRITLKTVETMCRLTFCSQETKIAILEDTIKEKDKRIAKLESLSSW